MTLLPICERLRAQLAQGWVLSAHAVHTTPHAAASAPPARSACYQLTSVGNEEYTACAADGAYALRLWVRRLRGQQRYLLLTFESDGKGARIPESSIKTRRLPATEATARALRDGVLAVVYGVLSGGERGDERAEQYAAQHGVRATYAGVHLARNVQRYMAGEHVLRSKKEPCMKDLLELVSAPTPAPAPSRENISRKRKDRA